MKKTKKEKRLHKLANELYEYRDMCLQDEGDLDSIKGILSQLIDAGDKSLKPLYEAMCNHGATITITKIDEIARKYGVADALEDADEDEDDY